MINSQANNSYIAEIAAKYPYTLLSESQFNALFEDFKFVKFKPGQVLLRPDELPQRLLFVLSGKVRLLAKHPSTKDPFTLQLKGSGQLLGWVSLLRGEACEWVIASEETVVISIPAKKFISAVDDSSDFQQVFASLPNIQESFFVVSSSTQYASQVKEDWFEQILDVIRSNVVVTVNAGQSFQSSDNQLDWLVSTSGIPDLSVGTYLTEGQILNERIGYNLPYRIIGFSNLSQSINSASPQSSPIEIQVAEDVPGATLQQLGILEDDLLEDNQRFPEVRGKGKISESLAVVEMISTFQKAPFRKDVLEKVLEDQFRRDKPLSIELLARLCELLGLNCQLADIESQHIRSLDFPVITILDDVPCILYSVEQDNLVVGHPHMGVTRLAIEHVFNLVGDRIRFALPRRVGTTPLSRFGWNWFTPLLGKYKKALILVFVASLLAQLFGLAIPLLIQQIIDKVLSQGNLSSLNVLGTVMVVLALFQGILMSLRTFIFVDTTDRMDLTLGSAVIDRLLALPLSFFDKRPVGELSQRIGELNTIRGFLTGTALVSVLNIIFATLYLVVMIVYSPLLTAVALSTLPLYFLLIFGIAPIYKLLIRKRAVAQAKTQSHLIEVLSGIQTVKAQHFELTARWKWQDRYREFVDQGFRSVALGSTSGEIGKFLNQLSGLLVLWVGMWLVLESQLSLGQLIAFRIISNNVTGPLLQLSGLYQGFQKVQISMERLSDIIDQNPELSRDDDLSQIPLPPITGNIRFENTSFRFAETGPNQVDSVSLTIPESSFVGIVGQSGSGKSTLMKLLPRLYEPNEGRIFIDDYDICKVNLSSLRRQIGIVPQDSLLFEGSIAENISLNDPQATTESIIEAAKIACAHDFIMSLGQGYATKLSERGSNLSGGQRQRIAIARTILSNPRLLVMDEATSALDYNTERQVCLNLQEWASGRTVLFITHRLSSIRSSDLIVVMESGCVVEQGTHTELLALNQRYATLYNQQDK